MRIVAGTFKGRPIEAPQGTDTRPTTDRVREALFSSLYSLRGGFDEAVVLDAFAGSGALGIEALSRGARHVTFFENDGKAVKVLKRNLAVCKLDEQHVRVVQKDVLAQAGNVATQPFDLVFLDPPYAFDPGGVLDFVKAQFDAGTFAPDAIVAYEHSLNAASAVDGACSQRGLDVCVSKKYGKTAVKIVRKRP